MDVPYLQARIEWETSIPELVEDLRLSQESRTLGPRSQVIKVRARSQKEMRKKIKSVVKESQTEIVTLKIQTGKHENWTAKQVREEMKKLPYVKSEMNFNKSKSRQKWNFEVTYVILTHWLDKDESKIEKP